MAKIIQISRESRDDSIFPEIREVLNCGGVIGFPTDTFYGLGTDPWNPLGVEAVFSIKKRPPEKPILVLISSLEQLEDLAAEVSEDAGKLIATLWPGPLTLLFSARPELPHSLTAGSGKIGVRLPANPLTIQLIESLGRPLTAPSANLSGAPSPLTAREVDNSLGDKLPLIVDGGPCPGGKPSTILDVSGSTPGLIREGAASLEQIEKTLDQKLPSSH